MSPRNVSVSQVFSAPASIPVLLAHGNLTLRVVTTVEEEVRAGVGNLWRRLVLPKRIDCWSLTSHPTNRRAGDKKYRLRPDPMVERKNSQPRVDRRQSITVPWLGISDDLRQEHGARAKSETGRATAPGYAAAGPADTAAESAKFCDSIFENDDARLVDGVIVQLQRGLGVSRVSPWT